MLDGTGHTTRFLHKIKFFCDYGKTFFLIESFLSIKRLWVVSKHKSSSKCAISFEIRQNFGPWIRQILVCLLFFFINCLPDYVLCKIASWSVDASLSLWCDKAYDLSWQVEIAFVICSCNMILKIKFVGKYFFSSATFWFCSVKVC